MPTPVTTIKLEPGAPSAEIGVQDQAGNPLAPGDISWALDPALSGVTVMPNPDGVGFDFLAAPDAKNQAGLAVATYTVNGVSGSLGVEVVVVVTGLQFAELP